MRHYHFFYVSTDVKWKTCSPSYFSSLVTVVYSLYLSLSVCLCLYAFMKQIFLSKEDILLHIRFLKLVHSEEKIT